MDSQMASAWKSSVENHFSLQSNAAPDTAQVPLKVPFVIGKAQPSQIQDLNLMDSTFMVLTLNRL